MTGNRPEPMATTYEVRVADPSNPSGPPVVVARICHEPASALRQQWVLYLLPGQHNLPDFVPHQMDNRYATKARSHAEAREALDEAATALIYALDTAATTRQRFIRALDKATGDRTPTLPLGEHDPSDDRP